jgi:hypothetical protein
MAGGTFVERDLFQSKPFISLSGVAPQVLINFLGKRIFVSIKKRGRKTERQCINCDSLKFPYVEAKRLGISQTRFTRAIDDLLAKGFISVVHKGGTGEGDLSRYAISDKWQLWQKGRVIETRLRETVTRGFCRKKHAV